MFESDKLEHVDMSKTSYWSNIVIFHGIKWDYKSWKTCLMGILPLDGLISSYNKLCLFGTGNTYLHIYTCLSIDWFEWGCNVETHGYQSKDKMTIHLNMCKKFFPLVLP